MFIFNFLFCQIGFEKEWLEMLKSYVAPMVTRHFPGHYPEVSDDWMHGHTAWLIIGGKLMLVMRHTL